MLAGLTAGAIAGLITSVYNQVAIEGNGFSWERMFRDTLEGGVTGMIVASPLQLSDKMLVDGVASGMAYDAENIGKKTSTGERTKAIISGGLNVIAGYTPDPVSFFVPNPDSLHKGVENRKKRKENTIKKAKSIVRPLECLSFGFLNRIAYPKKKSGLPGATWMAGFGYRR